MLYIELKANVKLDGISNADLINILIGLKQGCPCSPQLFAIFFDRIQKYVESAL
jgi:hypothetical protein